MSDIPSEIRERKYKGQPPAAPLTLEPVLKRWRKKHDLPDGVYPYQYPELASSFFDMCASKRQQIGETRGRKKINRGPRPGVMWDERSGRWRVMITVEGKTKHIGYFPHDELQAAIQAREDAERKYWARGGEQ